VPDEGRFVEGSVIPVVTYGGANQEQQVFISPADMQNLGNQEFNYNSV